MPTKPLKKSDWRSPANEAKALLRWKVRYAVRRTMRLCLRCGMKLDAKDDAGHFVCLDCRRIMAIKNRAARVSHKLDAIM